MAEVSKIENLEEKLVVANQGRQSEATGGPQNEVVGVVFAGMVAMVAVVTSPTTARYIVVFCNCSCACTLVAL